MYKCAIVDLKCNRIHDPYKFYDLYKFTILLVSLDFMSNYGHNTVV